MADSKMLEMILEESKTLPEDKLREVRDFVLFLKKISAANSQETILAKMQEDELVHLEEEFLNYKTLYPNE